MTDRTTLLNILDLGAVAVGDWVKYSGLNYVIEGMGGAGYQQTTDPKRSLTLQRGKKTEWNATQGDVTILDWATDKQRRFLWNIGKSFKDSERKDVWQTLANMKEGFTKAQAMNLIGQYVHAQRVGLDFEEWALEPHEARLEA